MLRIIVDGEDMGDFRTERSALLAIMAQYDTEPEWAKYSKRWSMVEATVYYVCATQFSIQNTIAGKMVIVEWVEKEGQNVLRKD